MLALLRTIAWPACVVYSTIPLFWLAIHPRAAYWRKQQHSPYWRLVPLWILMWIATAAITARWRSVSLYETGWAWLPATLLIVAGLWIYRRSGIGFSSAQLGGIPEIVGGHPEQRLATSGIRAQVRHPVYLGHLCEMAGWSIGSGLAVCYALTLFAVVSGAIMIRWEDSELERRFGNSYREYKRTVPAIVPRMRLP